MSRRRLGAPRRKEPLATIVGRACKLDVVGCLPRRYVDGRKTWTFDCRGRRLDPTGGWSSQADRIQVTIQAPDYSSAFASLRENFIKSAVPSAPTFRIRQAPQVRALQDRTLTELSSKVGYRLSNLDVVR